MQGLNRNQTGHDSSQHVYLGLQVTPARASSSGLRACSKVQGSSVEHSQLCSCPRASAGSSPRYFSTAHGPPVNTDSGTARRVTGNRDSARSGHTSSTEWSTLMVCPARHQPDRVTHHAWQIAHGQQWPHLYLCCVRPRRHLTLGARGVVAASERDAGVHRGGDAPGAVSCLPELEPPFAMQLLGRPSQPSRPEARLELSTVLCTHCIAVVAWTGSTSWGGCTEAKKLFTSATSFRPYIGYVLQAAKL